MFPDGKTEVFTGPWGDDGASILNQSGAIIASIQPGGSSATYAPDGTIVITNGAGVLTQTLLPDGDTTVPWPDGELWFDASGNYLEHEVDGSDGTKTFYDDLGNLAKVDHPDGSASVYNADGSIVSFSSAGVLTQTLLPDGDTTVPWPDGELWFDASGNYLEHEVDGSDGTKTFYDDLGNLAKVDHPDGSSSVYNADGSVASFSSAGVLTQTLLPDGDTTVPWPDGELWFDASGNYLEHEVDGSDGTKTFYDDLGNLAKVDHPDGSSSVYNADGSVASFSSAGVLTQTLLPDGDTTVPWPDGELWFDASGNYLEHEVDGSDGTKTFYDDLGNLAKVDHPDGSASVYNADGSIVSFSSAGVLTQTLLPDGDTTVPWPDGELWFDASGNYLEHEVDGSDGTKTFYDDLGNLAKVDHPDGSSSVYNADGSVASFSSAGVLTQTLLPDGDTTVPWPDGELWFDASGNYLEHEVDGSDGTKTFYDDLGNLAKVDHPDGSSSVYNADGSVASFSSAGVLTQTLLPDGDTTVPWPDGELWFDASGNYLEHEVDGSDGTKTFYDDLGNLAKVDHPDGSSSVYNADGSVASFSSAGVLTQTLLPDGDTTVPWPDGELWFDASGNYLEHEVDGSDGTKTFYDDLGNLAKVDHPDGSSSVYNADGSVASFSSAGVLTQTLLPDGDTTVPWPDGELWFDASGNYLEHEVDGSDGTKTFYDDLGNLAKVDHPDGSASVYNADGSIASFSSAGVLTQTLLPDGDTTVPWPDGELWFDASGNYLEHEVDGSDGTKTSYDDLGNLAKVDHPDGSSSVYNADGSVASFSSAGVLTQTLLPDGDTTVPWPDGELWFDASGNYLEHEVDGSDGTKTFYDDLGNLAKVDHPDGSASVYNADGSLICMGTVDPISVGANIPLGLLSLYDVKGSGDYSKISGAFADTVSKDSPSAIDGGANTFILDFYNVSENHLLKDFTPSVDAVITKSYGGAFAPAFSVASVLPTGGTFFHLSDESTSTAQSLHSNISVHLASF